MQSAATVSEIQERAGDIQILSAADQNALAYLEVLQRLAAEIDLAMEAIACNRPAQVLEGAHRQESLLPELVVLCRTLRHDQGEPVPVLASFSAAEIRHAELVLRNSVRNYSALLQRSARSIGMLARLHSSYAAEYPSAGQPIRTGMTWSCEG